LNFAAEAQFRPEDPFGWLKGDLTPIFLRRLRRRREFHLAHDQADREENEILFQPASLIRLNNRLQRRNFLAKSFR
jgi:hypothetical protein